MIGGIARPILQRRPAIGGIPEQNWESQGQGDQPTKQCPAGEQQAALRSQQQAGDQRDPPEEHRLLRQQAQPSHQAKREPPTGLIVAQQDDEDGGGQRPPEDIEDVIGIDGAVRQKDEAVADPRAASPWAYAAPPRSRAISPVSRMIPAQTSAEIMWIAQRALPVRKRGTSVIQGRSGGTST